MISSLKPWQHLAVSLFLLFIITALVYLLLVLPALKSRQLFHERLDELQFQYGRFTSMGLQTEQLREEVSRREAAGTSGKGFIEEQADSLAAADLQNHIKTLVSTAGGNLVSTQVITNDDKQPVFPAVSIKVHLRGDVEALHKILHALLQSQPLLLTDNVLIQRRNSRSRNRRGADQLEVRVDVTAFVYQSRQT